MMHGERKHMQAEKNKKYIGLGKTKNNNCNWRGKIMSYVFEDKPITNRY